MASRRSIPANRQKPESRRRQGQPTARPRLSPTSLSQYVRLENCERYLRFRLQPDDVDRLEKKWGLTIQPLTPLLKESGADFEHDIAARLVGKGEAVVDLDNQEFPETLKWLREVKTPTVLFQPSLEATIGDYDCSGRADLIRLSRDPQNRLKVLIADIKASRTEKMEHRLQVATYARMIQVAANQQKIPIAEIKGTVLIRQDDGSYPTLGSNTPTFDLDTYLSILDRLVVREDSVVKQVASRPFEKNFYHLGYKCDGCLYNALCMYDSAERLDIALTPQMTPVEKRVLNEAGITTLPELAGLMDLPSEGGRELRPAASQQKMVDVLNNRWPVAANLPTLVQRARAALHHFVPSTDYRPFLYGAGFGTLPSDEEHPGLIKIFFDAQRDYLQDRVYLISALVIGPRGQKTIVSCSESPPGDGLEKELLIGWVRDVIGAVREVAAADQASIHLYCYNRYDQGVLLEALKRHLGDVSSIPAFFDLLTQTPALTQSIISFLADEVADRLNPGRVCSPLHDVARWRGFDWKDAQNEYFSLFRARMFDNRRNVKRGKDGHITVVKPTDPDAGSDKLTIESASRFNSQIPLEYAYAAWNCLPENKESSRLLEPFRRVNLAALRGFAGKRVQALAAIEGSFKVKTKFLTKQPFSLPSLATRDDPVDLARSLREFLYMEHHTTLQTNLLNYSMPIERRVQSGTSMLLRYSHDLGNNLHQFGPEFQSIGLDAELAMSACRLKEGDWVILNSADENHSANQLKHGRLAIIETIRKDEVVLQLLDTRFPNGGFRYFHLRLQPEPGRFYVVDPMSDDLNADKVLESLTHVATNVFFEWLGDLPLSREALPGSEDFYKRFADLINAFLKNSRRKLTPLQRETIEQHHDKPLILVQGPPGTGKSYTLAWAILARIASAGVQGKPCRVLISCKTHNAINVELRELAEALHHVRPIATTQLGGDALRGLEIFKIVIDPGDLVAPGAKPFNAYENRQAIEPLLQRPFVVIGATSGGAYNLMKYRPLGGRSVDWTDKPFDLVVIDEASQMSVPEGVLAASFLKPSGNMIVVGDHRQMPPIIAHPWKEEHKRSATEHRPYLSLFETLVALGFPQVKLDESFRLHEQLAEFLRENVYAQDGIDFHSRRTELIVQIPKLHPYVDAVLDPRYPIVVIEHEERASQQFNLVELQLVRPLIEACVRHLSLDGRNGIGIVVPHRAQKALLRAEFPELADVNSIDTVERFQGDERDVIIVSATASDPDYVRNEASFLLNLNRLNVAISRPRKKLIVVASRSVVDLLISDLEIFQQALIWKRLFHHYALDVLAQTSMNGYKVIVKGRKP